MKKRTLVVTAPLAVAGLAAAGAARNRRAWSLAPDPTGGQPLGTPPGEERAVATPDGGSLAVLVAGPEDGPLVVLAHGWTNDRRFWGPVATRLVAKGHRVVSYDQPGHGASTVGRSGLTIDVLADGLKAVLEDVDARHAVVAGHSMGGMTAQAMALRHPDVVTERVAALVLVATACDNPANAASRAVTTRIAGSRRVARAVANPTVGPFLVRGAVGRRPVLSHLRALADAWVATDASVRAGFVPPMFEMDLSEGLRRLDLPVEIVVGTKDTLTPPPRADRMAEVIPGAHLTVVPDAGHMLHTEVPDLVTDLITSSVPAALVST